MIDASDARLVVEGCIAASRNFWGIDNSWEINWNFCTLQNGVPAECEHIIAYRRANIDIDLAQCDTLGDVWEHTAHEMCHVVVAEFDVYRHAVEKTPGNERVEFHPYAWEFAVERTVTQLQRVFLRERPYDA
jgi:hypothetical protein